MTRATGWKDKDRGIASVQMLLVELEHVSRSVTRERLLVCTPASPLVVTPVIVGLWASGEPVIKDFVAVVPKELGEVRNRGVPQTSDQVDTHESP